MPDIYLHTNEIHAIQARSKRRIIGQKPPLKPKEVWSIRVRLRILVILIIGSGFIRSPDLPNAMS